MYLKAICCDVFRREMYAAASRSVNTVDLEFLTKGLHNVGAGPMRARIQAAIDAAGEAYDAIVLAYGLCNNGLAGIDAHGCPLVLPRAHDCITAFLGSRARYAEYFDAHPGTYFKTTGWLERRAASDPSVVEYQIGFDSALDDLIARYGEDNGRYLYETLSQPPGYRRMMYIATGVETDGRWERMTREEAEQRGWTYENVEGNIGLLERLLDGPWDEADFLVVRPGETTAASFTGRIVDAGPRSG